MSGIYIHVPFCRKKCDYCNFYSVTVNDRNLIEAYINALLSEIKDAAKSVCEFIDTIYLGGGTPSLLTPNDIARIVDFIHSTFNVASNAEITLECNPDNFSIKQIEKYSYSVNRIILGVQTLDEEYHKLIGRAPGLCNDEMLASFFRCSNVTRCIDIMVCLPGQTIDDLKKEFDALIKYKWQHISVYTLTLENETPAHKRINPLSDYQQRKIMEFVIGYLESKGYIHYEVSNYALPGFESRHNSKYWNFEPYIGFGPGAHSFYKCKRYYNAPSVIDYVNGNNKVITDVRTKNSEIVEYIFTSLRKRNGFFLKHFESCIGITMSEHLMERIERLKEQGSLEIKNQAGDTQISLTKEGFFIMDKVVYSIVEDLL